jgi:hypothetical protein
MLGNENIRKISDFLIRGQSFLVRREVKGSITIDVIVIAPKQVKERIQMSDFFINFMSN